MRDVALPLGRVPESAPVPGRSCAARVDLIRAKLADPRARGRFEAKVARRARSQCWHWLGALHPHGHGRFWVGSLPDVEGGQRDVVMIAHRFAWALEYGLGALLEVPVLAHECDEAGCQNPGHLAPATMESNREDWLRRRWHPRSPLRDTRGAAGRARAIRHAILNGEDLDAVLALGVSPLDEQQLLLW